MNIQNADHHNHHRYRRKPALAQGRGVVKEQVCEGAPSCGRLALFIYCLIYAIVLLSFIAV